jgi:hypothetical protein
VADIVSGGKVVCTGRRTHKKRDLARYEADAEGFVLTSLQPSSGPGTVVYPGVEHIRFKCPSCPRDLRFLASTFHVFLTADTPKKSKDVSALGAIRSGARQAD